MPQFLVEVYLSRSSAEELIGGAHIPVAAALCADGPAVRHLRSILLPADETCLHLFEAADADAVRAACARGGITFDRLVEAADVTAQTAAQKRPSGHEMQLRAPRHQNLAPLDKEDS